MNVCVFCSSNSAIPNVYVEATLELGNRLGEAGHTLVFGGYRLGLMGEIAQSVQDNGGEVIGVTTQSLSYKNSRVLFPCSMEIEAKDLTQRKDIMTQQSDVFITLPGGIGTFDEFFGVLAQKKAHELDGAIVLLNVEGYFNPLIQMLDDSCIKGLNSNDWRADCELCETVEEVMEYLDSL